MYCKSNCNISQKAKRTVTIIMAFIIKLQNKNSEITLSYKKRKK